MRRVETLLVLLLALAPGGLVAQGGTVRGRVADTAGAPLAAAIVSIEGTGLRVASDVAGGYEIRGVPGGAYTLRARLLGYVPLAVRVTVLDGATVDQDIALAAQAIALSPIDVTVGSRAAYRGR